MYGYFTRSGEYGYQENEATHGQPRRSCSGMSGPGRGTIDRLRLPDDDAVLDQEQEPVQLMPWVERRTLACCHGRGRMTPVAVLGHHLAPALGEAGPPRKSSWAERRRLRPAASPWGLAALVGVGCHRPGAPLAPTPPAAANQSPARLPEPVDIPRARARAEMPTPRTRSTQGRGRPPALSQPATGPFMTRARREARRRRRSRPLTNPPDGGGLPFQPRVPPSLRSEARAPAHTQPAGVWPDARNARSCSAAAAGSSGSVCG